VWAALSLKLEEDELKALAEALPKPQFPCWGTTDFVRPLLHDQARDALGRRQSAGARTSS
jgi:hypothetical protein